MQPKNSATYKYSALPSLRKQRLLTADKTESNGVATEFWDSTILSERFTVACVLKMFPERGWCPSFRHLHSPLPIVVARVLISTERVRFLIILVV
jgi:hypothetical protein